MRSPVLTVDAQDLGSEDDAVSEDDTDHEQLPVEGEQGEGQDVVLYGAIRI